MKYPIHNRLACFLLACTDWLLQRCFTPFFKKKEIFHPQNILLCNTAHLGDVILTTALLPVLRSTFPNAQIGMLVGSWSRPLLEEHPLIDRFHLIDHWKISRRKKTRIVKILRYYRMRRHVRHEIGHYDLAIDCGLHFPNMAPLLWQAAIPVRIGFTSAGFSPLLTHSRPWDPHENRSVVEAFFSLLKLLPFQFDHALLHPTLPLSPPQPQPYLVVHMGSGNPQKNWPEAKWRSLVERLSSEGEHLVFTGTGVEENALIERICSGLPNTQNLCGQLSWKAFTTVIQNAALLIATDTSAGHVAAATDTPAVLLYTGIHPSNLWKPYGNKHITLTHAMPCSPCLIGCKAMTCIRVLSIDTVYATIKSLSP